MRGAALSKIQRRAKKTEENLLLSAVLSPKSTVVVPVIGMHSMSLTCNSPQHRTQNSFNHLTLSKNE